MRMKRKIMTVILSVILIVSGILLTQPKPISFNYNMLVIVFIALSVIKFIIPVIREYLETK